MTLELLESGGEGGASVGGSFAPSDLLYVDLRLPSGRFLAFFFWGGGVQQSNQAASSVAALSNCSAFFFSPPSNIIAG